MKRIKVLGNVLKRTRADKIIIGFIVFIFVCSQQWSSWLNRTLIDTEMRCGIVMR